jgi:hypothetical protein
VSSNSEESNVMIPAADRGPGIPADRLEATVDPSLQVRAHLTITPASAC